MTQFWVKYFLVALALIAVPWQANVAHAAKEEFSNDKRIKVLRYDPNDVYTIYTLYGFQTNIEFSENERVRTISVGDRSLWQIVPADHRLFIRPQADSVTTNMTIITDRRTYQFDIKSGSGDASENPNLIYVARFSYPKKEPVIAARSPVPPPLSSSVAPLGNPVRAVPLVQLPPARPVKTVELNRGSVPSPVIAPSPPPPPPIFREPARVYVPKQEVANFNYTYTGPDNLAPVQLYDDGRATYMRFESAAGQTPRIYDISHNKQLPVDYQMVDGFVVLRSTHTHILLDYGHGGKGEKVHIYNENLLPASL